MTKLVQLEQLGQTIWLDFIRRSFITSGDLERLVSQGVRGVTSNPAIFKDAIAGSSDYDAELRSLVKLRKSIQDIYETMAFEDIRRAADILRPVYDQSNGLDGYVSLEVSPILAHDTKGTVVEARRLFRTLNRPNIMIKIPATHAGIPAIESSISEGINVNVTLIFSLAHYEAASQAYIAGLKKFAASGGDVSQIASVASFFISRVDTVVDKELDTLGESSLKGQIAIANAKTAYARFKEVFSGERWQELADRGARPQRPLWASTGTKNPDYSDTLYIDNLIGPQTVNTVPPETLQAFLQHGSVSPTLESGVDTAYRQLSRLPELGINLDSITQQLQEDGVAAFADSFEILLDSITGKRDELLAGWSGMRYRLGNQQTYVDSALSQLETEQILPRIWASDYTVWKHKPDEITNRLGWLDIAARMVEDLPKFKALTESVQADGFTKACLLGMGGSSLAPEVFQKTFGARNGYLDLVVADSTDPGAVGAYLQDLDISRTLFIVSTKSGGTVETLSLFKFFYNQVQREVGAEKAGEHFIAITDSGSQLEDMAEQFNFRSIFLNDANIGGRYAALSYFGLVPASLIGIDLDLLLERALEMIHHCRDRSIHAGTENPCALLGAILGAAAKAGRNKLTLITSPELSSFADWVEQLVAESTGKEGKGILPVVGEVLGTPEVYGSDRLFVYLSLKGDLTHESGIQALENDGRPVVRLHLRDSYDLGGQFFLWEMATAIAGHFLGINPFDQPDVESAKILARKMAASYQQQGALPVYEPALQAGNIGVYGETAEKTPEDALAAFISMGQESTSYVALQAYIQPTVETDAALRNLQTRIRDKTRLAVTSGYGPRFLHSTGQLHKGDAGNGLFIQFTSQFAQDFPIPDQTGKPGSSISFGVLKMAQALGDNQALKHVGRRVMRFDLGAQPLAGLELLSESI